MTNEEAILTIDTLAMFSSNLLNDKIKQDIEEARKIAIEALGKQIPKKMNTVEGYHYCCFTCPTCNEYVRIYQDNGYCLNCGQKLDWSDYE